MEVDKEGEQAAGAVYTPSGNAGDANGSTAASGPVTSPSGVTHAEHSLVTPAVSATQLGLWDFWSMHVPSS